MYLKGYTRFKLINRGGVSMDQEYAIERIRQGVNLFVTGGAGRGKSYIIRQIYNNSTVLVAPTGIAALNIGGITCHSAFGLPFGYPTAKDWVSVSSKAKKLFGKGSGVTRIILDEGGMCSAVTLDVIDAKLKLIRGNDLPFGGIQMVMVGDFFQLEPIVNRQDSKYFFKDYEMPYAFAAKSWNFETVVLLDCKRQEDTRQVAMLDAIREGTNKAWAALRTIQKEAKPYDYSENTLHLCNYKDDAAYINKYWYDQVEGKERSYFAKIEGDKRVKWNDVPVQEVTDLKVGCKVVCAANCQEGQYVNGSHGTVTGFGIGSVRVQLDNGDEVLVEEFTWEKFSMSKGVKGLVKTPIATFTQVPLKLGYAVTAHSSQGCTLDHAAIHVGRGCFSAGQLYMMLSRITDLRNLSFVGEMDVENGVFPVGKQNIIVSEEVQDFYENILKDL